MANGIAFLWGFAEATLFFIVPDVALSLIALDGLEAGLVASAYAVLGALLGGAVMFVWGHRDRARAARLVARVPAIPRRDMDKVQAHLQRWGIVAMLVGPTLGIPYKIYALYASQVTDLARFLGVSIPARGVRFVLVVGLTRWLMARFAPQASLAEQQQAVLWGWAVIYAGYFAFKYGQMRGS